LKLISDASVPWMRRLQTEDEQLSRSVDEDKAFLYTFFFQTSSSHREDFLQHVPTRYRWRSDAVI
jgi:hypothetical protein